MATEYETDGSNESQGSGSGVTGWVEYNVWLAFVLLYIPIFAFFLSRISRLYLSRIGVLDYWLCISCAKVEETGRNGDRRSI